LSREDTPITRHPIPPRAISPLIARGRAGAAENMGDLVKETRAEAPDFGAIGMIADVTASAPAHPRPMSPEYIHGGTNLTGLHALVAPWLSPIRG
jgi:hypothetical protein